MSLRAQLIDRIETARHLGRVLADIAARPVKLVAPRRRRRRWRGIRVDRRTVHGGLADITALELHADQLITKITSVYHSRQLLPALRAALTAASIGQ